MSRWVPVLLVLECAIATSCIHRAPNSGPYVWQLRGAVVSVSDTMLRVRHKTGEVVDVRIDDHTAYLRNGESASPQSLRRGTRVMVNVETVQRGMYRARLVQIFGGGRVMSNTGDTADSPP